MPDRDQVDFVPGNIKFVDHAVIPDANPIFLPTLQPLMWKRGQPLPHITDFKNDSSSNVRRERGKQSFKFLRINFSRLSHAHLRLVDPHTPSLQIRFTALDALNKTRIQLSAVFQILRQPILKLLGLFQRQCANLRFNRFQFAHRIKLTPLPKRSNSNLHISKKSCFEPMEEPRPGCHMALAVTIGKTRLIDNALI